MDLIKTAILVDGGFYRKLSRKLGAKSYQKNVLKNYGNIAIDI